MLSGPDGQIHFVGLYPGDYRIRELLRLTDTNEDGIADDDQGLVSSTGIDNFTFIGSGDEVVWRPGAADLLDDIEEPDALRKEVYYTPGEPFDASLIYGNYVSSSIHGFKFEDLNANGIWDHNINIIEFPGDKDDDDAEPPLWGVTVLLHDEDGELVDWTKTNQDGEYWFTSLRPGRYFISERLDDLDDGIPATDTYITWRYNNGGAGPDLIPITPIKPDGIPDGEQGMMATIGNQMVEISSGEEWVWQDTASFESTIVDWYSDELFNPSDVSQPYTFSMNSPADVNIRAEGDGFWPIVTVLDFDGSLVDSGTDYGNVADVDLPNLAAGTYTVYVTANNNFYPFDGSDKDYYGEFELHITYDMTLSPLKEEDPR